jgi:glycosyltransferase involved in cell wall biosynthesis
MLAVCRRFAPVTWTLHDAWSFTGRCAYFRDCGKYLVGCDDTCPTPREYPALAPEWIEWEWRRKLDLFQQVPDLAAVSPSRWLAHAAAEGIWRGHPVHVVPNGLDLAVFAPLERQAARVALKIDPKTAVLLISAWHLGDPRKGSSLLVEALARVSRRPLCLLTMGRGVLPGVPGDVRTVALGYVADERRKTLAYNAADLFVHASLADNLPNTVMEAMACGTPTAAFAVGGVPELVRPGGTGWLAGEIAAGALAAAIDQALSDICGGRTLRPECRRVAESEYDQRLQAGRYASILA